jgi:hypothetical protein
MASRTIAQAMASTEGGPLVSMSAVVTEMRQHFQANERCG